MLYYSAPFVQQIKNPKTSFSLHINIKPVFKISLKLYNCERFLKFFSSNSHHSMYFKNCAISSDFFPKLCSINDNLEQQQRTIFLPNYIHLLCGHGIIEFFSEQSGPKILKNLTCIFKIKLSDEQGLFQTNTFCSFLISNLMF